MSLENPPGSLTSGERDRWRRTETLFGLPHNDAEAHLFAFLVRHLLPASMSVFEDLVKRSNGRATARYRLLVVEVRGHLADAPTSHGYTGPLFLSEDLARRLREATD